MLLLLLDADLASGFVATMIYPRHSLLIDAVSAHLPRLAAAAAAEAAASAASSYHSIPHSSSPTHLAQTFSNYSKKTNDSTRSNQLEFNQLKNTNSFMKINFFFKFFSFCYIFGIHLREKMLTSNLGLERTRLITDNVHCGPILIEKVTKKKG